MPDDPFRDPQATVEALGQKVLAHLAVPAPELDPDLPDAQPDNDAPA